uniref:Exonuclease n=1 Tax=Staphylothermus marinus TaxID=2280 RepID=A0A7C4D7U7_STAMA
MLSSMNDICNLVNIDSDSKAILIGRNFEVDGFCKRNIRIITHAHADHVIGLNKSIMYSKHIVSTPATYELVSELGYVNNSLKPVYRTKSILLDYFNRIDFDGEILEFYPVEHIIGSTQVRVLTDNYVIGYTSDFKLTKNTFIMKDLDVLIIEATYGDPVWRRPFKNDVIEYAIDILNEGLKKYGRVVVYGYYGKLQEFMKIIRDRGIDTPFLMNDKIYSITRIVEKYGWRIGNFYRLTFNTKYFDKYIVFEHMNKAKYRRIEGSVMNFVLTGREFEEPVRKIDEYTWLIALSDHADFDELINYVEISQPKLVIIDNSRDGYPYSLARELEKRGWKAIVMPP